MFKKGDKVTILTVGSFTMKQAEVIQTQVSAAYRVWIECDGYRMELLADDLKLAIADGDKLAEDEFDAQTAELTNQAIQLASDESVIEEAWHLVEVGADYSIQPRFFENADIGMYTYQPDMIDGEWPTPEVWLVDQRTCGCNMAMAIKLVRVI